MSGEDAGASAWAQLGPCVLHPIFILLASEPSHPPPSTVTSVWGAGAIDMEGSYRVQTAVSQAGPATSKRAQGDLASAGWV